MPFGAFFFGGMLVALVLRDMLGPPGNIVFGVIVVMFLFFSIAGM